MAVTNPPTFIQAGSHPAENVRRYFHAMLGGRGGIISAGDLAVAENGTPNLSVNIAAGQVLIPGTQATFQGIYECESRATENRTIAAADATNPRKDLVVAQVKDAAYSGVDNLWDIFVVTGTPAPSPSEPATPANSWVLAMVDVPANDTAVTNSQITDRRTQQTGQKGRAASLGGVIVCTSTNRPGSPTDGMLIYETDTDSLLHWDGTNWLLPDNVAGGKIGYAQITADQTGITSETDITGLSVTVTVGAGRRIRIQAFVPYWITSVAGDRGELRIKESTTILSFTESTNPGTAGNFGVNCFAVLTPSAGAHTYKIAWTRAAGTGSHTFGGSTSAPAFILVEDIGT